MERSTDLTALELRLLLGISALHPDGYGVSIQKHIDKHTRRKLSSATVYAGLDRLKQRGFVRSRQGEAMPARGGKPKMYFSLTSSGRGILARSLKAIDALRATAMPQ